MERRSEPSVSSRLYRLSKRFALARTVARPKTFGIFGEVGKRDESPLARRSRPRRRYLFKTEFQTGFFVTAPIIL